MTDETPPTNELIERLTAKLSPAGRRALEELDTLGDALADTENIDTMTPETQDRLGAVVNFTDALGAEDRQLIARIAELTGRAYDERGKEYADEAKQARLAVEVIERAQALERAVGNEPDESMTLGEALLVFAAYGEPVPEYLEVDREVEVPTTERTVPAFYPNFTDADEWKRWDGSEQAEAWTRLMEFREAAIVASIGELAGIGVEDTDYAGVIAALWGIEEDEAAEFVRLRQGGQL
jgi:hypothetical protein